MSGQDTFRVERVLDITEIVYRKGDYDQAGRRAGEALALSKKLNYKSGEGTALGYKGLICYQKGDYPEALEQLKQAVTIFTGLGDKRAIGLWLGNVGMVHSEKGDYTVALEYYLRSLRIAEDIKNKKDMATRLSNLGLLYNRMNNQAKALDYYYKALAIDKELKNKRGILIRMSNIGSIYRDQAADAQKKGDTASFRILEMKALAFMEEATEIATGMNDKKGIAINLNSMGSIYEDLGDFDKALLFNLRALKLFNELENKYAAGIVLANIGHNYMEKGEYAKARKYMEEGVAVTLSIHARDGLPKQYFMLYDLSQRTGQWDKALDSYKKYVITKDSLSNEQNTKKQTQLEMQYEFEKKEAAVKLEQEKKDALAAAESRRQRIILFAISGIGLLVLGFAIFAYRSFLQKKRANVEISRQKQIIEEKQKEVLDSIYYARRIQRSLLPNEAYIHKTLKRRGR